MAQYTTPKNTYTVFNSDTFIDRSYITRSEADDRYINENDDDGFEKFIGSLQITSDEQVTNMAVNGSLVVSQGASISGNTSIGQPLSSGAGKTTSIYADTLRIGTDSANALQTSNLRIDSVTTTINSKSSAGSITVGNWSNPAPCTMRASQLNLNSEENASVTTISSATGSANVFGNTLTIGGNKSSTVNINGKTKVTICQDASANGLEIGNGLNTMKINNARLDVSSNIVAIGSSSNGGKVYIQGTDNRIGVDSSGNIIPGNSIQMEGSVSINRFSQYPGVQTVIGSNPQDMINQGQTNHFNSFLSTANKIYNPILLKADGNESFSQFNLNLPHHLCTASGITRNGNTGGSLPQMQQRSYFINIPNLPNEQCVSVMFEYTAWVNMGRMLSNGDYTPYTTNLANVGTNISRNRYYTGVINLIIMRGVTSGVISTSYYLVSGTPSNPFSQQSFSYINNSGGSTSANYTPLSISQVAGSATKMELIIRCPNINQTPDVNADVCIAVGSSVRLISASDTSASYMYLSPSNQAKSWVGSVYLSMV